MLLCGPQTPLPAAGPARGSQQPVPSLGAWGKRGRGTPRVPTTLTSQGLFHDKIHGDGLGVPPSFTPLMHRGRGSAEGSLQGGRDTRGSVPPGGGQAAARPSPAPLPQLSSPPQVSSPGPAGRGSPDPGGESRRGGGEPVGAEPVSPPAAGQQGVKAALNFLPRRLGAGGGV